MKNGILTNGSAKIEKAIQLLSQAAEAKKSEITEALESTGEQVQKAVLRFDKNVHRNPWAFIGGAAAATVVLGFLLGRFSKK